MSKEVSLDQAEMLAKNPWYWVVPNTSAKKVAFVALFCIIIVGGVLGKVFSTPLSDIIATYPLEMGGVGLILGAGMALGFGWTCFSRASERKKEIDRQYVPKSTPQRVSLFILGLVLALSLLLTLIYQKSISEWIASHTGETAAISLLSGFFLGALTHYGILYRTHPNFTSNFPDLQEI